MNLFIAVPCYGGQGFASCWVSITGLTHELRNREIGYTVRTVTGESLIPRGRNTLTHEFLRTECTHLLFIDTDLQFSPEHVIGMLEADKDLVGGAYPKKSINAERVRMAAERGESDILKFGGEYVVNVFEDALPKKPDEDGSVTIPLDKGCVPVSEVGTGFMLVKRDVFVKMWEAYPDNWYLSDARETLGHTVHNWFDCPIVEHRLLSEDYSFCQKWRAMGGTIWLYLPANLTHIGTYPFRGDLMSRFTPVRASGAHEWDDIPSLPENDPQRDWHLFRYRWCAERLQGKLIANAACGSGYGSRILAERAMRVVGFDRNETALAIARNKYANDVCEYEYADLQDETLFGFEALCCVETLEHLPDPVAFLRRLGSTVKELALSVPIVPTKHANVHHLHDFTEQEILNILRALGWTIVETAHQDEWKPKAVLLVYARRGAMAEAA